VISASPPVRRIRARFRVMIGDVRATILGLLALALAASCGQHGQEERGRGDPALAGSPATTAAEQPAAAAEPEQPATRPAHLERISLRVLGMT
jgi:hypothetical protein